MRLASRSREDVLVIDMSIVHGAAHARRKHAMKQVLSHIGDALPVPESKVSILQGRKRFQVALPIVRYGVSF